jgi:glycosyltransferase involved in cell wall biosynthesis
MSHRKIRVLQLIDTFNIGGAEKIVLSLATKIDRDRFEVIPCALFRSGPLEEEMKAADVLYRIIGSPRKSILTGPFFIADLMRMIVGLTGIVRELSIDIIHAHLTNSTLVAVLATRGKNSPSLCATMHSVIFHKQRSRLSLRAWLMHAGVRSAFARISRIIAVSDKVAQAVQLYAGVTEQQIKTILNGVDPDLLRYREDRNTLRQGLNLPKDRPVLVSVGRLIRPKGYPHLLAAVASMPSEERPLTLIAGDGPDRRDLESQVASLKLEEDVRLLGNRGDVPALLAAADLFVLASLWEGLPLALLEAMAAGVPAVVTAVGDNSKLIQHGMSGLLVPPKDEFALAAAVRRMLLLNPLERKRMGRAAREHFDRHYSLRKFIEAHESLYEEMIIERSTDAQRRGIGFL